MWWRFKPIPGTPRRGWPLKNVRTTCPNYANFTRNSLKFTQNTQKFTQNTQSLRNVREVPTTQKSSKTFWKIRIFLTKSTQILRKKRKMYAKNAKCTQKTQNVRKNAKFTQKTQILNKNEKPCLKYANFTQNLRIFFCVRTPKFWVVNPSPILLECFPCRRQYSYAIVFIQ